MGLEDFDLNIENSDSGKEQVSSSLEISEKAKEDSKRASAGIKRTQKDEKKAKKYDLLLASFLVKIILDKKYDFIVGKMFYAMDYGYTSNFVLGIISLINTDISNKIRENNGKTLINFSYKSKETIQFDDSNLPKEVKNRVNLWIEDIIDTVVLEASFIQMQKIISLLEEDDNKIYEYISDILTFFMEDINIYIKKSDLIGISKFIVGEVLSASKKIMISDYNEFRSLKDL